MFEYVKVIPGKLFVVFLYGVYIYIYNVRK